MPRTHQLLAAMVALGAASLVVVSPAGAAWKLERTWEVQGLTGFDVAPSGEVSALYDLGGDQAGIRRYGSTGRLAGSWDVSFNGSALAIATHGRNVLVSDSGDAFNDPRLLTFTGSGRPAGQGPLTPPVGDPALADDIDIDRRGDRYFSYFSNAVPQDVEGVLRLDASGRTIAAWGASGAGPGQFDGAAGVASDGRGNVYVVEAGNDRVQRFSDRGAFVRAWGQFGTGPGQFADPIDVATDPGGDIWVADANEEPGAARVQHFRPDGRLVERVTAPNDPGDRTLGVGFDRSGRLYVATGGSGSRQGDVYVYREVVTKRIALRASRSGRRARGKRVRLSATLRPCGRATRGQAVTFQRRVGRAWRAIGRPKRAAGGRCAAAVTLRVRRTTKVRAVSPAKGSFGRAVSKPVRLG